MAHCEYCKQEIRLGPVQHRCAGRDAAAKEQAEARRSAATCSALAILQGCGLHGAYYNTIEKAAKGARDIIRALRADLHDPPHDIQCAVLRKLGVEGFTKEGVAPTHQLIPLPNTKDHPP